MTVILSTQPEEPWSRQRMYALSESLPPATDLRWMHETVQQNPQAPGFWEMWRTIMEGYGFQPGDIIIASESYGLKLAEVCGGVFMPYDIDREILDVKATRVRDNPLDRFADIAPAFQKYLRKTVTIFGAESTGKTTLSRALRGPRAHWLPEWARPYLETVGAEITTESMKRIWEGQRALQDHAQTFLDKPFVVQDTDLFSTVGYWDFWNMRTPPRLASDAMDRRSDLYLITRSNIPFEPDPLRYGGDKREADDGYWVRLCERFQLPYVVLDGQTVAERVVEAEGLIEGLFTAGAGLGYVRQHNG